MIKKTISIILSALLIIFAFSACASHSTDETSAAAPGSNSDSDKLSVVATIFPAYDFVRQIAGDCVNLTMLLAPGGEAHSYAPTADDMLTISRSDLFISIGGESDEEWVSDTLDSIGDNSIVSMKMMDSITAIEEELKEGMEPAEEEASGADSDEEETEYDEHVWTSPVNAIAIAKDIADKLCELDKANEETYRANSERFIAELTELDGEFKDIAATAKYKTLIFADRFPFRYFVEEYGFDYYAAFAGCSASADPSAETISFLISKVKELKVPVVFTIEFSTGATAETVCEATGAKAVELHSCHNVSQEEFDSGVTYVSLMKHNVETLKEALECDVTD